jgi:hypothetical protein
VKHFRFFAAISLFLPLAPLIWPGGSGNERREDERLTFQTSGPWSARTNLNADVAMAYGIGPECQKKYASSEEFVGDSGAESGPEVHRSLC